MRLKSLFEGKVFLLNREVQCRAVLPVLLLGLLSTGGSLQTPLDSLEFVILSAGGVALRADLLTAAQLADAAITHHVVDRPLPAESRAAGRSYVQPQWVYDSFNARALLPVDPYAPVRVGGLSSWCCVLDR